MKQILVTGGAGFLGSHLCDRLVEQGHVVTCIDNYSTGSQANIAHLMNRSNFTAIEHNVCTPINLEVDEIYNLACPASPRYYQLDPINTMKTNVIGAYNVLGLAMRTGAKILQASTSEVYGDPLQHPKVESYWGNVNPNGLRSCYDEGKRAAETIFTDYNRVYGVPIKIVRIFNTYGPGMAIDDGRVVSNLIVQSLRGQPITIYGSGHQTRSFCYVDDLIDAMMQMMGTSDDVYGPINIGNPMEYSITELAHMITQIANKSTLIRQFPLPQDDPVRRRPDIAKAIDVLGWYPKISLEDGLQKTIEYFRKKLI
jgi:UDP-glucuronate decarboxylase